LALALLEAIPEGVVIVDEAGAVTYVNHRGADLFGRNRDELIGASVDVILPPSLARSHRENHADHLLQDPGVRGDVEHGPRDGREDVSGVPIEVAVVLRGAEATAVWQTVLAGDGDGLGSLTLNPSLLGRLAEIDDSLILSEGPEERVYID
jgi:PAS domain S-box-containing protein